MRVKSSLFSGDILIVISPLIPFTHTMGTGVFSLCPAPSAIPDTRYREEDTPLPPYILRFRISHSGRQPEPLYSVTPERVGIPQSRHPGESRGPESLNRSLSEKDWIPAQRIRRDDGRRKERGEGPPLSLSPERNACLMGMHDEEEGSP